MQADPSLALCLLQYSRFQSVAVPFSGESTRLYDAEERNGKPLGVVMFD